MKSLWIGIGIVCVVIAVFVTYHDPHDETQNAVLNISDEILRNTTKDSPLEEYVPRSYDPYLDENMQKIVQKDLLMAMGDSVTLYADVDEGEDLLLFSNLLSARDITVRKPDGSMSLYTDRLSGIFDHPLVIPVDEAGTWSVTVTRMTAEERYERPPQFASLLLASRPAAVELELPEITDDPYLLSHIVANLPGIIVVTETVEELNDGWGATYLYHEEPLSLSQPLADGWHSLSFQRVTSDGRVSRVTYYSLIVDSRAPEIMLGDFEQKTSSPYILLTLTLSDNVIAFYISGELYDFGSAPMTAERRKEIPLEVGVNHIELRAVSLAGHETVRTVTITRQGEIPEYVEMDGYWLHYYYNEDGNHVEEWIHGESDPRSSMK